jgi:hypothetical protein
MLKPEEQGDTNHEASTIQDAYESYKEAHAVAQERSFYHIPMSYETGAFRLFCRSILNVYADIFLTIKLMVVNWGHL